MAFIKSIFLIIASAVTFGLVHNPNIIPVPTGIVVTPTSQVQIKPMPKIKSNTQKPAPTPASVITPMPQPNGSTVVPTSIYTPPPNTTLCNGTYYTACPAGQNFVCPSSGGAYCQNNQLSSQKAQALTALYAQLQFYQNQYTQQYNQMMRDENEFHQQCDSILSAPIEFQQGSGAVTQNYNLQVCNIKSQTIFYETQSLTPIQNNIADIQQRINTINSLPIQ